MEKEKWSYPYNADTEIKQKLIAIRNTHNLLSMKDAIDYAINACYKEMMVRCTQSKNSTNN